MQKSNELVFRFIYVNMNDIDNVLQNVNQALL